jgi:hypothetical protein
MGAVLGGLCPAPYRLGGDEESGWTASQQSRVCADLAAASRTLPFSVITLHRPAFYPEPFVVTRYGSRTVEVPTVEFGGHAQTTWITWPSAPLDEQGERYGLRIVSVSGFIHGSTAAPRVTVTQPNRISLVMTSGESTVTIKVYAQYGNAPRIEDYGGDLDKRDAERETTPYAWLQYQELGASMGSGYGSEMSGSVHAHKLAYSRALAACYRSEERLRSNAHPDTADALLEEWARSVDIPVPFGEPRSKTRKFASVMLAAESGQSIPALERSCEHLLGKAFLGIRTFDVDDPPGVWPASWDLGSGVWASTRCKFLVDVRPPLVPGDPVFRDLVQVRLMRMLDRLAPSHSWFNWTIPGEGFYLDISPLDYTAL